MKLTVTEKERKVLSVALQMYTGEFPWAYGGASFFRDEATRLMALLEKMDMVYKCGWHPLAMDDALVGEVVVSSKEATVAVRALQLYTGKFPDAYAGASLWRNEATSLAIWIASHYVF